MSEKTQDNVTNNKIRVTNLRCVYTWKWSVKFL